MPLTKAGANWVEGPERFFDREAELETLAERAREGIHTLLTAQRRMGKTSLVRESLRRLAEEGAFETVFADLEDASGAADAIAEIAVRSRSAQGAWRRIAGAFANLLQGVGDRIEEVGLPDLRVKLRAGIDAGNWRQRGDAVFAALAGNARPAVLALDELPILIDRMLKQGGEGPSPEGGRAADAFLGWLRKNGQEHRGRVVLVLSGSVGLEPVLEQAGLSAQANIYAPLDLEPWDEKTAMDCLGELAAKYGLDLPGDVRRAMCGRLRRQVPHHVQQYFDHLHARLRRADRREARMEDAERVYEDDMLSVRGQADMAHYESRLLAVLGREGYRTALALLTEAAVSGGALSDGAVARYRAELDASADAGDAGTPPAPIGHVLHILQHDGYLERREGGYRFVSGLLEDWWRARHGHGFPPIGSRTRRGGGA